MIDLGLFRRPVFAWGLLAGFLSYAAMFSQTLLTPFLLAGVLGLAPGALGLVLTAVPVALSVSSPLSGWISDRFGGRSLTVVGTVLLAAGLLLLSFAGPGDGPLSVMARLGVAGVGMGLFQSPNNAAVMSALPRERLGTGGGLLATARNAGMAAGIGLAGAISAAAAGSGRAGADGFLAGYALSLRAGAALAVVAAVVSLAGGRASSFEPPRA